MSDLIRNIEKHISNVNKYLNDLKKYLNHEFDKELDVEFNLLLKGSLFQVE